MQFSIKEKNKTENTENKDNIQLQKGDTDILTNTNQSFSEILQGGINNNSIKVSEIKELPDIDFCYDAISININDAMFFISLAQEEQLSVQTTLNGNIQGLIKTELTQNILTQKSVEVTNQIIALIEKAQKTQGPVRISFDNNISVILKIDKQGKLSAEFIPGNSEVESYLMKNISSLRQKFDEQNLAYNNISYRQNSRQGKNKNRNKGEA